MVPRVALCCLLAIAAPALGAPPPLVVLSPAGASQEGLPVLVPRPPGEIDRCLSRGFSGRLLRLYALEQEYLRRETGAAPEPAYLLLSTQQGGFPRFGFVLDGTPKPGVGYVDLHQSSTPAGRFGAMDQIFPHELLHVIARQLAGEPRESGANQVHAIGVRTDPVTAFQEGFAEHVQIMCVDDPDALPATRALRDDRDARARAEGEIAGYARSVGTRYQLGSPPELRFLLWFSPAEQVQRYHAVKANAFARDAPIPGPLLQRADKYAAYLFHSVVPGAPGDPLKPAGELLSTEGVVAHLFWRWVTDPGLQQRRRDDDFYARFGVTAAAIDPLENVYLKIFHALRAGRAGDTVSFLRAYVAAFPDEAALVQQVVTAAFAGHDVPDAPEIWLANPALRTGTSLFDQFRALPRAHTFDANAASAFDWMTVPGVTPTAAARMMHGCAVRGPAGAHRTGGSGPGAGRADHRNGRCDGRASPRIGGGGITQPLGRGKGLHLAAARVRRLGGGTRRVAGPPDVCGPLALGHPVRAPVRAPGVRVVVGRHQSGVDAGGSAGPRRRTPGGGMGRLPQALLEGCGAGGGHMGDGRAAGARPRQ